MLKLKVYFAEYHGKRMPNPLVARSSKGTKGIQHFLHHNFYLKLLI